MKVNDPNLPGMQSTGVGRAQQTEIAAGRGKNVSSGNAAGGDDEVQLSRLSSQLRALSSESPERAAYLERLAEDVASRRYRPDALEVSRSIINDALQDKPGE